MRESERAGLLRKAMLDIVIDTINQRTGGATKYINQRDEELFTQSSLRKITEAIHLCAGSLH